MYNGIGVPTARGTGTNGYVQKNLSFIAKPMKTVSYLDRDKLKKITAGGKKETNAEILEHDRRRKIELMVIDYETQLESKGLSKEEIEKLVDTRRSILFEEDGVERSKTIFVDGKEVNLMEHNERKSHMEKNERMRRAFKLSDHHERSSFFSQDRPIDTSALPVPKSTLVSEKKSTKERSETSDTSEHSESVRKKNLKKQRRKEGSLSNCDSPKVDSRVQPHSRSHRKFHKHDGGLDGEFSSEKTLRDKTRKLELLKKRSKNHSSSSEHLRAHDRSFKCSKPPRRHENDTSLEANFYDRKQRKKNDLYFVENKKIILPTVQNDIDNEDGVNEQKTSHDRLKSERNSNKDIKRQYIRSSSTSSLENCVTADGVNSGIKGKRSSNTLDHREYTKGDNVAKNSNYTKKNRNEVNLSSVSDISGSNEYGDNIEKKVPEKLESHSRKQGRSRRNHSSSERSTTYLKNTVKRGIVPVISTKKSLKTLVKTRRSRSSSIRRSSSLDDHIKKSSDKNLRLNEQRVIKRCKNYSSSDLSHNDAQQSENMLNSKHGNHFSSDGRSGLRKSDKMKKRESKERINSSHSDLLSCNQPLETGESMKKVIRQRRNQSSSNSFAKRRHHKRTKRSEDNKERRDASSTDFSSYYRSRKTGKHMKDDVENYLSSNLRTKEVRIKSHRESKKRRNKSSSDVIRKKHRISGRDNHLETRSGRKRSAKEIIRPERSRKRSSSTSFTRVERKHQPSNAERRDRKLDRSRRNHSSSLESSEKSPSKLLDDAYKDKLEFKNTRSSSSDCSESDITSSSSRRLPSRRRDTKRQAFPVESSFSDDSSSFSVGKVSKLRKPTYSKKSKGKNNKSSRRRNRSESEKGSNCGRHRNKGEMKRTAKESHRSRGKRSSDTSE